MFAQFCWSSQSTVDSFPPTNLLLIVLVIPSLSKVVTRRPIQVNPTPFWIVDSGSHSLSVELGFWIAIVSRIPDSPSCIPDSKAWHSRIPQTKFSRIPDMDSSSTNFRDFGNRIPLHGTILGNFSFKFLQQSVNMGLQ